MLSVIQEKKWIVLRIYNTYKHFFKEKSLNSISKQAEIKFTDNSVDMATLPKRELTNS